MSGAFIYVRVSSEEQVSNFSLDSQQRACIEYCERVGLNVVRVFREEGASAKTANRPELQKMINACAIGGRRSGISTVVVYRVDRLARDVGDHYYIKGALESRGIAVRSVAEHFDDSPAGKFMENMLAAAAQFDNDVRSSRTSAGMKEAVRQGRWVWRPPLGYLRNSDGGSASLLVDPQAGPLIKKGFEAIASRRLTKAQALEELTQLGLMTRRGVPVTPQVFGPLLRNHVYMGRIVNPKWGIDVEGDFEPIVDPQLFKAVQDVLDGRAPGKLSRIRNHPDFPLRGVIRCGECNSPLTASWTTGRSKTRYPYYRCPTKNCGGTNIRKERLEQLVVDALDGLSLRREMSDLLSAVVEDSWRERVAASILARDSLTSKKVEVDRKRDVLMDRYLDGKIADQDLFESQMDRLKRQESEIRAQLDSIEVTKPDLTRTIDLALAMLEDLPECWNRVEPPLRGRLIAAVFPEGLSFKTGSIGTMNYPWWLATSEAISEGQNGMAPQNYLDWNQIHQWLGGVQSVLQVCQKSQVGADSYALAPVSLRLNTPSPDWKKTGPALTPHEDTEVHQTSQEFTEGATK